MRVMTAKKYYSITSDTFRPFFSGIIEKEKSGLMQAKIQQCPTLTPSCASVPPHYRACEVKTCFRKSHRIP